MKSLKMLLLSLCVATLAISANGAPYQQTQEQDCDDDNQRPVNNAEFLQNAHAHSGHNHQNSVYLDSHKIKEQYEKLKQKADQFVGSSGTNSQDFGIHGGSFNKFEAGQSQISSSLNHHSGLSGGIRTPVATNFYNNDGSLLHTVEGLKAQDVQYTATGGILPLKNYQDGQVFSHNHGGYGGSFEKHSSSSSHQSSSQNSGFPGAITYTPAEYEKHHQSSSVSVEESVKRRNFTDFSKPELISQQTHTVLHPLNIGYGAQQVGVFSQGSKTHANYDHSNSASYGHQVPITIIPPLGSNDATNYLSETKSQSLSKTLVSSHDSAQGVNTKPIKIQTNPTGINANWQQNIHSHVSSQAINNPSAVLQTSFGTTEAENEEDLLAHLHPVTLTVPQNSHYTSKQESQQSSSSSSFQQSSQQHSSSGSSFNGQASQNQIKGSSGKTAPTNTYVGNPNAPQNSGYAITGENKGFYAKSVELANLISATLTPMEETPNQNSQQTVQQGSSSSHYDVVPTGSKQVQGGSNQQQQSGYTSTFIQKEKNPVIISGGKGYAGGYNYEKHQSSSSQYEKTQGSQISGNQGSYSGVQVIDEPYRASGGHSGGYTGGSSYDWSTSGNGYGQYILQNGQWRPAGYGTQTSGGYGHGQSSSFQSFESSKGSQGSSGRGVGAGFACKECAQGSEIQFGYGTPVKSSYGLSSQFSSSSSNVNGQKSESKQASVTVNDNGKVDTYSRHNK